ncbi:MAG: TolC family protein [Sideroxydans sp.]|nr:TolC family protein [Sideroxydans sp.]
MNKTLRISAVLMVALAACQLAAFPRAARAEGDLLSTGQYIEPGQFPQTADSSQCDRERIRKPLVLADVVELALCNNPQTRSLWASARAQAATLGVSMSSYLPTLSLQGSGSRSAGSNSRSVSLTASYLLYDFGARAASVENAKQLLVAANATRDATLQTNFLTAVQSYYGLLSARASVASLEVAEQSARESLAAAEARYLAGVATPTDKLQAQTALAQATLNLITAQGTERTAQGTLANIMGFDASQPFTLASVKVADPDPAVEQDIGRLIEQAREKRPDLVAADAQIKSAEAQLAASRAANMPSISLSASTSSQRVSGTPTSNSSSIGISLSVPLFTGLRNTYQIRSSESLLESKVAARDLLANQIALDVWKAYQTLLTNSQALRTANALVTSAEQSAEMTLGRYKAGVANLSILDVLNAQSALASARQQQVSALYNFQSSRLGLVQAIGQLDLTQVGIKE